MRKVICFQKVGNKRNISSALFQPQKLCFSGSVFSKEKYFDKILVANRGEIACRVMKTCKRLGIKTVAVFSDADANSKHVHLADEAVNIGKAPVNQSYLLGDVILEAMKSTGAQAVHPGYGFLSENTEFAGQVEKEGLAFIGPPSPAIHAMGDKIESKIIAKKAGVNIIPGFEGEVKTTEEAVKFAKEIGYPVMIKASAGGGGKGMRIAWNDEELVEGFNLSQAEAVNFFKNKTMLIEKFIENPRHIEIQIICDKHGNRLYLPERECSIQRRNQKVIEEAPSLVIDPKTRKAMGEQAVALAGAVNYESAGTVEMLVDPQNNFYFLEMNTRLQVEHPITEYITGIDLVEQMIRVASGKPLPFKQEDVSIHGWATECRVYAEDPSKNFSPSIGSLNLYKEPGVGDPEVRVDSGILEGSEISVYYDPMICKLITHGKDRSESIKRMIECLDTYVIDGVRHNIPLLRTVLDSKPYKEGKISTNFLKEQFPDGFKGVELTDQHISNLVVSSALMEFMFRKRDNSIINKLDSFRAPQEYDFVVNLGKDSFATNVSVENDLYIVDVQHPKLKDLDVVAKCTWNVGEVIFKVTINDRENITMQLIERDNGKLKIIYLGNEFILTVQDPLERELYKYMPVHTPPDKSKLLSSPMPGSIIKVNVKPGDKVSLNQELVVMEAMKMQNSLRSQIDGTVKTVKVNVGQIVSNNQCLIEFE